MENATKALEMAAGVLIGILIIGLLVFSFTRLSELKQIEENSKAIEQASDFNKSYELYNRSGVYGSELLSLANKISDYNSRKTEDGYTPINMTVKLTIPSEIASYFTSSNPMSGQALIEGYKKISDKITQLGKEQLEANVNGQNMKKTVAQWEKFSDSTLKQYFGGSVPQKILTYREICDGQTDLARKTFKKPNFTYDGNTGRIILMEFEEN